MRIHELAKELNLSGKELLEKLHALKIEARSTFSTLEDDVVDRLRAQLGGGSARGSVQVAAPEPRKPVSAPIVVPAGVSVSSVPPPPVRTVVSAPKAGAVEPHLFRKPGDKLVVVTGPVVVRELAECLALKPNELISELMAMNILASINQRVDLAIARKIIEKHGLQFTQERKPVEQKPPPPKKKRKPEEVAAEKPENVENRPPVVVFMGHVDHGKTSLMDKIRNSAVAKDEFGGITQHIGAYTVTVGGHGITFLDTPGHAAFTAMRARGANLTDVAVIVIDAVDGIMPQTEEAITHARAAGVALIVAINKVDLPAANVMRVKQQLQGMGLVAEDWGGQTICCAVSAITGEGIEHLLEMLLLQSEMLDLKANPHKPAEGFVIEAEMRPGMGPTANLLIKDGTLKIGDAIVCGACYGRVRALITDHGVQVKSAKPSTPVRCLGLSGVPPAGAAFKVLSSEKEARTLAGDEAARQKQDLIAPARKASLDDLFAQMQSSQEVELRIVLKTDTQGSLEALQHALAEIQSTKVSLHTILSGTGNITSNDVMLASASNAIILGFHVAKEAGVDATAKREGVEIRLHTIIYRLIDEVREAMTGLLAPIIKETVTGHAEILQVFPVGKNGRAAGCRVSNGIISARVKVRLKRGKETIYEGAIASLKRFRESVSEVREGLECGIRLDRDVDILPGDILECYTQEQVKQTL